MNEHVEIQREVNKQACTWGVLCHLTALIVLTGIPLTNILGPFVVWLLKKNEFPFVNEQGKESMNFQISMTIFTAIAALFIFIKIGFILMFFTGVVNLILVVIASIRTRKGEHYQYPFKIKFIK